MKHMNNLVENLRYYRALFACVCARARLSADDERWPRGQWILGHRGARSIAPENTLTSFRLAMEQGADGVEFDIMPSSDGIPMVIHDDTLERTTDGNGIVWLHHSETLAALDATKIMPGFAREGIPKLKTTLSMLPAGALVNIEVKSRGHLSPQDFLHVVEREIDVHKDRLRIVVSSFDPDLLMPLREKKVGFLIALILSKRAPSWSRALERMPAIAPDAIHVTPDLATPLARFLVHRARMRIALWTINNTKMAIHWFKHGIDGIFTDHVQEIVRAVRGRR
jgi:glycerophosphoryl diester phosphodiesterase